MPRSPVETRERLISAAERLFATHGINGASLRQVARQAGQANTGAIQYHFGDRQGLVAAIVGKHWRDSDPRRHALLDHYEAERAGRSSRPPRGDASLDHHLRGRPPGDAATAARDVTRPPQRDGGPGGDDLRALAAALVQPLAAKLADPDGGRAYLRISAELYNRPVTFDEMVPDAHRGTSLRRWHALLSEFLPPDDRGARYTRMAAIRFTFDELARRAASPPKADDRAFTNALVDHVASVLATHPSPQTLRAVAESSVPTANAT